MCVEIRDEEWERVSTCIRGNILGCVIDGIFFTLWTPEEGDLVGTPAAAMISAVLVWRLLARARGAPWAAALLGLDAAAPRNALAAAAEKSTEVARV